MHLRFIFRQVTSSPRQTGVFVACVVLSIVTLVSIGGFGESVNRALLKDARRLLAGDIIVQSRFPFEPALEDALEDLATKPGISVARTYEFITIVGDPRGDETLLSELKVVEPGYPFYGEVALQSGAPFSEVLRPGRVAVGQNLLDRMGLALGDRIRIGGETFEIADIVLGEPDQPVDFFSLGPRIFLSASDLVATGLIQQGSRVFYKALILVSDDRAVDAIAGELAEVADPVQVDVDTFLTNQSSLQRFYEDFLTFLRLIGIFTLMLAGLGIQSSLTALIREREETIAIMRTLGATGRFVIIQFYTVAHALGALGTLVGLALAILLQLVFPFLFGPFLPPQVEFVISPTSIGEGILLGIFVVSVFTFLPINRLRALKPRYIFQKQSPAASFGKVESLAQGMILVFLAAMTYRYLQNAERTAYFSAGIVVLVLVVTLLGKGALKFLQRQRLRRLDTRQALRGLFRPRNATLAIIVTLSTSLSVLFTIYLVQRNLDASFVQAYPADAPNVFLLDIQPDQRQGVREFIGEAVEFTPLVSARIRSINGQPIPPGESSEAGFDRGRDPDAAPNLNDVFSLTYRSELNENETLVTGDALFPGDGAEIAQVSVLQSLLEAHPFQIGDQIEFDIQGVRLMAEVASIRAAVREAEGFAPLFSFVLREQDLLAAPQTIVTAVNVSRENVPQFQNDLVRRYPNITVIDIGATLDTLAALVADITTIIRFFTLFSLIAGVLIIISSVLATRFARIQEAVYFKVLGARKRFVLRVFALENVFLGLLSAALALVLSQAAAGILITQFFELDFRPFIGSSLLVMAGTVILVTTVGLLASVSILQKKPITFMREQTVE